MREVDLALAAHQNSSKELLIKLSKRVDLNITQALARNPKTPHQILKKIAEMNNEWVQKALLENPNYLKIINSTNEKVK